MLNLKTRRRWFWAGLFIAGLLIVATLLPGMLKRRAAAHSIRDLTSLILADERFSRVTVTQDHAGNVRVDGYVDSQRDLARLQTLIHSAGIPAWPEVTVGFVAPDEVRPRLRGTIVQSTNQGLVR